MKFFKILVIIFLYFLKNETYSTGAKTFIERPIVVVVCSYNNSEWSKSTLQSIFSQHYSNFRLIIVDDCSTDNNVEVIQKYIDDHHLHDRVTFIKNKSRHRKLFNLYHVLYQCNDDEIVVMVDGDDYLAHQNVLSYINNCYKDDSIWFTYGQYKNVPASEAIQWGFKEMGYCRPVPKNIQKKHSYREYSFIYMHPRSFRAWLFKLVKLQDLIADTIPGFQGNFYPAANDVAMYFPMVEMAHTHIKFIPEILYIRNLYSNIVGFKVDRKIQTASSKEVRKKNSYATLFQPIKNRLEIYRDACADIFVLCFNDLNFIDDIIHNISSTLTGTGKIYVFFLGTPDNKKICRSLSKQLSSVTFVPYDIEGTKTLKNRLLEQLDSIKNNHVYITTDEQIHEKPLNFSDFIFWLEKTFASRFYLNRTTKNRDIAPYISLTENINAWKIITPGKGVAFDEDTFICHKTILYNTIKSINFTSIASLMKALSSHKSLKGSVGLFYNRV